MRIREKPEEIIFIFFYAQMRVDQREGRRVECCTGTDTTTGRTEEIK